MKKIYSFLLSACLLTAATTLTTATAFAAPAAPAAEKLSAADEQLREAMTRILAEHPEIIIDVLSKHSGDVFGIMQQGAETMRRDQLFSQWESDFTQPKTYNAKDRPFLGRANAPLTLVSYSDFTCTYCRQASSTIKSLMAQYPNDIHFIFKSRPANDVARHASRWFYTAFKKDPAKAWKMHDILFDKQQEYAADPMAYIKKLADSVGFDGKAMEQEVYANLKALDALIDEDQAEAKKFGFNGTPYFLMNNLVLRGALPLDNFVDAITFIENKSAPAEAANPQADPAPKGAKTSKPTKGK